MFILFMFQLVVSICAKSVLYVIHYFETAKIRKIFELEDFIGGKK